MISFPKPLQQDVIRSISVILEQRIKWFKGKPEDMFTQIVPKLKLIHLFENDIIYSQDDSANLFYFLLEGEVQVYMDVSHKLNLKDILPELDNFNLPLANYKSGSYFGDNDFLCN